MDLNSRAFHKANRVLAQGTLNDLVTGSGSKRTKVGDPAFPFADSPYILNCTLSAPPYSLFLWLILHFSVRYHR